MRKKWGIVISCVLAAAMMAGCGSSGQSAPTAAATTAATTAASETKAETAAAGDEGRVQGGFGGQLPGPPAERGCGLEGGRRTGPDGPGRGCEL